MAFSYYRQLTFDRTKCGTTSLASFPALVSISNAAFGNHVTSPSGFDIVFATDKAGASKVPWEIESFDKPSGTLLAWVNVATLNGSAAASNSSLFMCFGDGTITTAQNTGANAPAKVWDANFGGVWHLSDVPTSAHDSTANANHSNNLAGTTAAAGVVGGGASFNGTSNFVNIPNSPSVTPTGPMTLSCWAKNVASGLQEYVIKWASSNFYFVRSNGSNYEFAINSSQTFACSPPGGITGIWTHVTGTYDGTSGRIYSNGVLRTTTASSGATQVNSADLTFGNIGQLNTQQMAGTLDEVRLSLVARSADWILSEYNNQNAPGNIGADNFVIFGPEIVQQQPMATIL